MNKTWLIIKREYSTRVRNKAFLISTFLLPIALILFIFGSAFFALSSKEKLKRIAMVNAPDMFKNTLTGDSGLVIFDFITKVDSIDYFKKGFDAVLYLNTDTASRKFIMHSKKQVGIDTKALIELKLDKAFENNELQKNGIHKQIIDSINKISVGAFSIENRLTSDGGKSEAINAQLNYGIGFGSGILIYVTMFIFGAMVMRGVMEEKTNRIAEIIVSSVKPFQLMMGKILGIAGVGLTQFLLWIILILLITGLLNFFLPHEFLEQAGEVNKSMPGNGNTAMAIKLIEMQQSATDVNWIKLISFFIFYFLGGYLFYASLFAAIGSVINEDPQEAQSLILPITMPIIFAFIIMSSNINTPDSNIMVWASIIPFTAPIVMMARIPSGVPWYQLVLSMVLLVAGFWCTTWIAAKIYRTGILMYGKKVGWKIMLQWAFKKS